MNGFFVIVSPFLIIKGFVKHFRMEMSDIKSEQCFSDSMYPF